MNDILYSVAASMVSGLGPVAMRKLIAQLGDVSKIFEQTQSQLESITGIGPMLAQQICKPDILKRAEQELLFAQRHKIKVLHRTSKDYPQRLLNCNDAPFVLFYKGVIDLNNPQSLSVVGTRNATYYGLQYCDNFLQDLSTTKSKPLIISGLAYGIDAAAHKSALDHGLPTLAVLAHGFDTIYPTSHKPLAAEMIHKGGLITEFVSGTKAFRGNFLSRNRIVAGMSDATLVIESASKGGSLVTAQMATDYKRKVFALSGRQTDTQSQGCNALIAAGKANLLQTAAQLVKTMQWDMAAKPPQQRQLPLDLPQQQQQIVNLLKNAEQADIDTICAELEIGISTASGLLLNMEFAGFIRPLAGKRYSLC